MANDILSRLAELGEWAPAKRIAAALDCSAEGLLAWRRRGIIRGLRVGPSRVLLSTADIAAQIRPAFGPAADGAGEARRS